MEPINKERKVHSQNRLIEIFEGMVEEQTRELHAAHQDLSTKNAYLTKIIAAMSDMLIVISETFTILQINPSVVAHLGYPMEALIGKSLSKIVDGFNSERFLLDVTNDACRDRDLMFVTQSGLTLPVTLSASAIRSPEGSLQGIVCVARDRSERERSQSEQVFSQKMESIGRLAAGIAHEINTPMQFIGDNAQFLSEGFASLDKLIALYRDANLAKLNSESLVKGEAEYDVEYLLKEIPQAINQTLEGIERVSKIVRAMKQFSHKGFEDKIVANVNEGIVSTVTISRSEWKYAADLDLQLDEALPRVHCQPDQINQVILNLIINAADAIREKIHKGSYDKGKISITTSTKDESIIICVADNGMGIPKALQDKVFDLFFTTKPEGRGTGQGLSIAHDIIVNKHGGRIEMSSELGVGTTFTLILPIFDADAIQAQSYENSLY